MQRYNLPYAGQIKYIKYIANDNPVYAISHTYAASKKKKKSMMNK